MAKHFTGQSECFHLCSLTWTERGTFLISGKNKKNTWLQRDISCLTPHRQTYQSFSLSVVISVPVSAADSWETRQRPFQKVTSQHSTSSLSFTPLTAPPPPPPLQSLCLFLWMLTMAFSVGKWLRLKECESVCDFVCVPLRTVTGCQGRRERENLTKWQQDRISVSHCDRVGVTKPGVTVEKEGGREKKNCCCYKSHSHSEGLALWKIAILSFFTKRIWSF